jgi:DNA polymerase I-like protein with 3'-5' exonuclease and polymerase domains
VVSIINNRRPPTITSELHEKAFEQLGVTNINWPLTLGIERFKEFIDQSRKYVSFEENFIIENEYYSGTFIDGRSVLFSLEDYLVDTIVLKRHLKNTDVRNLKLLNEFRRQEKIKYTQTASVTGRLSVASGPNILHLKREHRDILTSRHGTDGAIIQLDFKSLEPRILALIRQDDVPDDLYTDISTMCNNNIDRELAKKATLAIIYGMSRNNLGNLLRVGNANEIFNHISDYFGIRHLHDALLNSIDNSGLIQNFYGRNIYVDKESEHLLVNYFTQSTGVDVSLLGFRQIIDSIKKEELTISPLFVLHDALILDVHKNSIKHLKNMIKDGIMIPGFKQNKFPLDLSLFFKRTKK